MPDVASGGRQRGGGRRLDFVAAVAIVLALASAVLWGDLRRRWAARPAPEQCALLLERWAEQTYRARTGDERPELTAAWLRDDRRRARRDAAVASCGQQLTAAQVSCALAAPNIDEIERCLQ